MAKTSGDAKLGAAGAHLMEFSHKVQPREATAQRGPAQVIQLPLWPEAKRGAPNAVLRAALFAAIQGKGRQYILRKELIATQDGVTIRYTGGAARPGRPGRVGTGPALGPDAGPRHAVPVHGERFSQSSWPAAR